MCRRTSAWLSSDGLGSDLPECEESQGLKTSPETLSLEDLAIEAGLA